MLNRRLYNSNNNTPAIDSLIHHFPLTANGNDVITGITPDQINNVVFSSDGARFTRVLNSYLSYFKKIDASQIKKITCEIKCSDIADNSYFLSGGNETAWTFGLGIWKTTGNLFTTLGDGAGSVLVDDINSNFKYTLNEWISVKLITENNYQKLTIGDSLKEYAVQFNWAFILSEFKIGGRFNLSNNSRTFDGWIRNVKIYNKQ